MRGVRRPRAVCLLSSSQRMYVDSNSAHVFFRQTLAPSGHHAKTCVRDGFSQRFAITTIKPDCICKIRRAQVAVALCIVPMTGGTIIHVEWRASLDQRCVHVCCAEAQDIFDNRRDFMILKNILRKRASRNSARPSLCRCECRGEWNRQLPLGRPPKASRCPTD